MTQPSRGPTAIAQNLDRREAILADLFVALADTLVDDFDVVELLDRLVHTCVDLFDISAAGLLLLGPRRQLNLIASSSERAEELELFQIQVDEGPCLDAAHDMVVVDAPDLRDRTHRWPQFCDAAERLGFRAAHAVPMRLRTEPLGVLGLFHSELFAIPETDAHVVQALADVATIGILQQRHQLQTSLVAEQLQTALNSRIGIEQAKGILAQSGGITMDEAFQLLRRYARNNNLKLSAAAEAVATRRVPPRVVLNVTKASDEQS